MPFGGHGGWGRRLFTPLCSFPPADAINNAAGFGFRGFDRHGEARWDLISNVRIQQIEVGAPLRRLSPYGTRRAMIYFQSSEVLAKGGVEGFF